MKHKWRKPYPGEGGLTTPVLMYCENCPASNCDYPYNDECDESYKGRRIFHTESGVEILEGETQGAKA